MVRSGQGYDTEQRQRVKDIESKLKEDNKKRHSEQMELDERLRLEQQDARNQKKLQRQKEKR